MSYPKLSLLVMMIASLSTTLSAHSADVQALIDAAKDGSTVTVPTGEHKTAKCIMINGRKNLTIEFKKDAKVVCTDVDQHVLLIRASTNVTIRGGHFTHASPLKKDMCQGSVIVVEDSETITLETCDINGTGLVGIWAGDSKNLKARNCLVHDNTREAFYITRCIDVLLTGNTIRDNGQLGRVNKTEQFVFKDNTVEQSNTAFEVNTERITR